MAFPCPRCGDRYTQSLPMVYGTGTHVRNWRSRSGYRGSTVSQSLVGGLATPPLKRSVLKPAFWPFVVWLFLGGPITFAVHRLTLNPPQAGAAPIVNGPHYALRKGRTKPVPGIPRDQNEEQVLIAAAIGATGSALLIWHALAALKFNRLEFPRLLHKWESAFMCRGCGAIFHPPDRYALRQM